MSIKSRRPLPPPSLPPLPPPPPPTVKEDQNVEEVKTPTDDKEPADTVNDDELIKNDLDLIAAYNMQQCNLNMPKLSQPEVPIEEEEDISTETPEESTPVGEEQPDANDDTIVYEKVAEKDWHSGGWHGLGKKVTYNAYNSKGEIVGKKEDFYVYDGTLLKEDFYTTNEQNQDVLSHTIEYTYVNVKDPKSVCGTTTTFYDENGKKTKTIDENISAGNESTKVILYDENENVTSEEYSSIHDGSSSCVYEYDAKGRVISCTYINRDGAINADHLWYGHANYREERKYQYNDDGTVRNEITVLTDLDTGITKTVRCNYGYDEKGQKNYGQTLTENSDGSYENSIWTLSNDGIEHYYEEYGDADGNKQIYEQTCINGEFRTTMEIKIYKDHGHTVKEEIKYNYDKDGNLIDKTYTSEILD